MKQLDEIFQLFIFLFYRVHAALDNIVRQLHGLNSGLSLYTIKVSFIRVYSIISIMGCMLKMNFANVD